MRTFYIAVGLCLIVGGFFLIPASELVLFDFLFYQKSAAHGYETNLEKTDRSQLAALPTLLENQETQVLGAATDPTGPWEVVVIGDEAVWGQGVRSSNAFPQVLGRMLNTHRETTVTVLAKPNASPTDYQAWLAEVVQAYPNARAYIISWSFSDATEPADLAKMLTVWQNNSKLVIVDPDTFRLSSTDEQFLHRNNLGSMTTAGIRVLDPAEYIKLHYPSINLADAKDRQQLVVSPNESSPSVKAHKIMAEALVSELVRQ